MGGRVTRRSFVGAFIAALLGCGATMAHAAAPPASMLEQQAQDEFAQAALALRERLTQEAAGDPIGARVSARAADLHRYRYLDLKRALSRLRPAASPSVAALRDPFVPDGSFLANSSVPTGRAGAGNLGGRDGTHPVTYAAWDMYRPRLSMEVAGPSGAQPPLSVRGKADATPVGQRKDMYVTSAVKAATSDLRALPKEPEAPAFSVDSPRQPFLVYREPSPPLGARE
jgi:hypothetical protein